MKNQAIIVKFLLNLDEETLPSYKWYLLVSTCIRGVHLYINVSSRTIHVKTRDIVYGTHLWIKLLDMSMKHNCEQG